MLCVQNFIICHKQGVFLCLIFNAQSTLLIDSVLLKCLRATQKRWMFKNRVGAGHTKCTLMHCGNGHVDLPQATSAVRQVCSRVCATAMILGASSSWWRAPSPADGNVALCLLSLLKVTGPRKFKKSYWKPSWFTVGMEAGFHISGQGCGT